jgi:hypothetical protein
MAERIDHGDNRIVHLQYDTQEQLCSDFVRLQEFYESPFDDIRGQFFTLDYYKQRYSGGGEFTYYTDWSGFNVPGNVVIAFRDKFYAGMRDEEWGLLFDIDRDGKYVYRRDPNFYVIATFESARASVTADHELAHAFFYLYPEYKEKQLAIINRMSVDGRANAHKRLQEMGYDVSVLDDEIQAYCSTERDMEYLAFFGVNESDAPILAELTANFVAMKKPLK